MNRTDKVINLTSRKKIAIQVYIIKHRVVSYLLKLQYLHFEWTMLCRPFYDAFSSLRSNLISIRITLNDCLLIHQSPLEAVIKFYYRLRYELLTLRRLKN